MHHLKRRQRLRPSRMFSYAQKDGARAMQQRDQQDSTENDGPESSRDEVVEDEVEASVTRWGISY